ncbi:hypothetical protein M9Y10_041386 [Tritrichomonas musculus]|uniref:DH domain-containing protein n=1 Tax=Tritrichomonas musculus TaxID=1915356 RepID=A0ABR2K4Y5_9EUKA
MATVTFILEDESILKKSPPLIINKTVSQILRNIYQINHHLYILAIKTPTYIEILPPNSIPLNIYPSLIVNQLDDQNQEANFSFFILNKSQVNKFFLIFKVSSPNSPNINFPSFTFGFIPSQFADKNISDFKKEMIKQFGIPISNSDIFLNKHKVSDSTNMKDFLQKAKLIYQPQTRNVHPHVIKKNFTELEFQINIEPPGLRTILSREKVLKEIFTTEMEYCLHLIVLNNHFAKNFKEKKILNEQDQQTIFGPIPKMIKTSSYLTESLTSLQSYSSCVGSLFSGFMFQLRKTSQDYFVNYNNMTKKVTKKLDSNPFVKEICRQAPENNKTTFQSMVIKPIQRFPRYVLLVHELLKYTPKSHPDYISIQKVESELKRMVHGMEEAHLVRGVKDIQERLEPLKEYEHQSIVTKDRILVEEFNVLLKEKKKQRGTLYLFNDLILLSANCEREREREIEQEQMRSEYNKFIFIPNYQDSTSIGIYFKEEMRIIEFSSAEQIAKFSTAMSELRSKMIENSSQNSLPTIKAVEYFPPPSQVIPMMTDTSCGKVSNSVSIVSYKSYMIFDTRHESLTIASDIKNVHNYSKVVLIKDVPYIYGGCKKAGPFELLNNKFEESRGKFGRSENSQPDVIANTRSLPTEGLKESRIHHTCCAYEEFIVIYGGVNPKNRGKLYSDIHFYSVDTGEWFISDPTILTPEPRYKHSAVVYKNLMIIHGGISAVNHAVLNDTWCYNFLNGKWTIINLKNLRVVVPRFGHAAAIVNRFMFILGGSTIKYVFPPPPTNQEDKNDSSLNLDDDSNLNGSYDNDSSFNAASFGKCDCVAAPSCFCVNIETGHLSAIEIEGNFLPGLSMFSAVYDEISKKIIIFGGTDPQNKYSKGLPIVSSLDIPQHYTSDNSKPPKEPVDVEKTLSYAAPIRHQRTQIAFPSLGPLLSPDSDKKTENATMTPNDQKPKSVTKPILARSGMNDSPQSLTPQRNQVHFPLQSKNYQINAPRYYHYLSSSKRQSQVKAADSKASDINVNDENNNSNVNKNICNKNNSIDNCNDVIEEEEEEENNDDFDVSRLIHSVEVRKAKWQKYIRVKKSGST